MRVSSTRTALAQRSVAPLVREGELAGGRRGAAGDKLLEDVFDHVRDYTHFHYQIASRSDPSSVTIRGPEGSAHTVSHDSEIDGVRFLPRGDRALTVGLDPVVVVWDTATGRKLKELPHHGPIECADVFPDGDRVVTCDGGATRVVWNATSGERLHVLSPPEHAQADSRFGFLGRGVLVFPDGGRIIAWGSEDRATIWDAATGRAACELAGHVAPISSVAVFPGGDRIVTGGLDRKAIVWNASTCEALYEVVDASWMLEVAVVSSGDRFATLSSNGRAAVWDAATGRRLQELVDPELANHGLASGIHAFPTDDRIVTYAVGQAVIWDASTGKALRRLRGLDSVYSCAVSPNGYLLVMCGRDQVTVWDLASGARLQRHRTAAVPRPPNACPVDIGSANGLAH